MRSDTLFGGPTRFDPVTLQRWLGLLTRCWIDLMGRPPYSLDSDLAALQPIFGNGTSPKSLKSRIFKLPEAAPGTTELPEQVVLIVDGCALITPEGRILLEELRRLSSGSAAEIDYERQIFALSAAANIRSEWYAVWLRKQFKSPISAPVIGAALFLLVNGSIGERHALQMSSDVERDRELGAVVMPLVAKFSRTLGGNAPAANEGIRQHWAFTQVSRLLGRDVAREKTPEGTVMFVRLGREKHLLDELARLLDAVGDDGRRSAAVMGLVDEYRRVRGPLAALGQMHEDPTMTRRITDRLSAVGGIR